MELSYWTRLILWYIGVRLEKCCDYITGFGWFYGILDLDLKNTWTNFHGSDSFNYNQAGMLLERCENLLESSVKAVSNIIKFSKFDFPGSDYVWCLKNKMLIMLFVAKLSIFRIQQELSKSLSLI